MAVTARKGRLIVIGLEEGNIEKLKSGQPFHHHLEEVGAPFEVLIFYGKDREDLVKQFAGSVGPDTKVVDNTNRKKH